MTNEDQVFVANVVVTDPTQEIMATSVISLLTNATVEFHTIVKINKYRVSWRPPLYSDGHGGAQRTRTWYGLFYKGVCLFFPQ